jgi:hypothetical protein
MVIKLTILPWQDKNCLIQPKKAIIHLKFYIACLLLASSLVLLKKLCNFL